MYAFILFAIGLGVCSGASKIGEKVKLTNEDVESDDFEEVNRVANVQCNLLSNSQYWFTQKYFYLGTKEVFYYGIRYDYSFVQVETNCLITQVAAGGTTDIGTCGFHDDERTQRCNVTAIPQPNSPERLITVTVTEVGTEEY
ncbi:hypothetical protein CRM22_000140 [Opisthorchis felineus]|uniref:Cystatin domain-containing protein n=1 Tax=Opisthorchis felineus TaxID=147828 RepID=A0A4S2MGV9_OPIFE|nr:hypothetical protein CRM22_000140 [Opisthorchis felineus]